MKYCSTRGQVNGLSFSEAVMMGLADDGGLLLPEEIPQLSAAELAELAPLPYPELAKRIIGLYADDIPSDDLDRLIERSYSNFAHPETTPLVKQDDLYVL